MRATVSFKILLAVED